MAQKYKNLLSNYRK